MLKYYEIMRNSKDKKLLRLRMIQRASEVGIKATSLEYNCSINTVRKWLRRYKEHGNSGLEEESRRPHKCRCLSDADKQVILKCKAKYKPFGALRLKEICTLPYSVKTINKVLNQSGLTGRRRKKTKTRNNLRLIKSAWNLFKQIQLDTKHLYDIPEYWIYIHGMKFPKYQYTARDATTGLLFISFAHEISITNSISFIEELAAHLRASGADLSQTTIQTDNGSEFIGAWNAKRDSAFTVAVEKLFKEHVTIKPKAHTWQADVETSHNLIETEFYEIERYKNIDHLLLKMSTYLLWFNFLRKNRYKENKTPLQLTAEKQKDIKNSIAKFTATILDHKKQFTYKGDHHVGDVSAVGEYFRG
jgi:transposase